MFLGVLCLYLCQRDLYANRQWFVLLLSLRIDGARKWSKVMAPALQQMKVNVLQGVQHASLRQPPDGRKLHDLTLSLLSWPQLSPRPHDNSQTYKNDVFLKITFVDTFFFLLIYFGCVFIFVLYNMDCMVWISYKSDFWTNKQSTENAKLKACQIDR